MAATAPDPVFTFRGHESSITALSFYKENELISGSETGEIIIWDLVSKRVKARWVLDTFGQPHNTILYIGCLGGPFITQSRNGYINFWVKGDNGRFLAEKSYESSNLSFCKASLCTLKNHAQPTKVENLLAFPTREDPNLFILLNINTGEMNLFVDTNSKTKELGQVMCSKAYNHPTHGDPKIVDLRLLTGHEIGHLVMWKFCADIRECYAECEVDLFNQDPIICLEMEHLKFNKLNHLTGEESQDEVPELPFHGICGSVNNKLITFEIVRGVLLKGMELELKDRLTNVVTLRRCENNRIKPIICAAGKDGRLRILSWKTFNFVAILKFHSDSIISAVFCPKSGLLAAGSRDLRITLWSVYQEP